MEPLSILGVAGNAVQFIDFTAKLISQTIRIYRADPHKKDHEYHDLNQITLELQKFTVTSQRALAAPSQTLSSTDKDILRISEDCEGIANRLLDALGGLRSSKNTLWNSFVDALKTLWNERDIQALQQTLDTYRQQLTLHLLTSAR